MTKRQMRWFSVAKVEACRSDFHGAQVGCVIVLGNRVLARAHNSEKTHCQQYRFNTYRQFNQEPETVVARVHAEIAALSKCRYADVDWCKAEIYIWRETKDGRAHGLARPCPACWEACVDRGIRHVFYTGDDSFVYEYITKR